MLKAISWNQYWLFMATAAGIYYLCVGLRYYKAELLGRMSPKGNGASCTGGMGNDGAEGGKAPAHQVELFAKEVGKEGGRTSSCSDAAGDLSDPKGDRAGCENKLDRENLLDHMREVLAGFPSLRRTEYAETINNFLLGVCPSELSLQLSEDELRDLWK